VSTMTSTDAMVTSVNMIVLRERISCFLLRTRTMLALACSWQSA
jgi:hypothetical protein